MKLLLWKKVVLECLEHSDRRELVNYARKVTPRPEKIFLIHGEKSKCISLASALHKMLKVETRAPDVLETVRLV